MEHVSTTILGTNPDEQRANTQGVLRLGFPDGVIAICGTCNEVQEFTLEDAAKHLTAGTWPRCHDRRMLMADPDDAPPF